MGTMKKTVMAFGAHPDDIELRCAGTLIKLANEGNTVILVDVTKGDRGSHGTPDIRLHDSRKALNIMGLKIRENLNIPDTAIYNNESNRLKVINIIRKYRPDIILIPYWDDRHPDHYHTSNLVAEASFYSGLKKIKTDYTHFRPVYILYYMCHYPFDPAFIVDISEEFKTKLKAVRAYKSQFSQTSNKRNTKQVLTPFSVQKFTAQDRFYGSLIGVKYGEPFTLKNPVKTNNPVTLLFS